MLLKISYLSCILCTAIVNVSRVTLITGHLQKKAKENIVKHSLEYPKTCLRLKISTKFLFLRLGNMVYSYMQSKKSLSVISFKKVTYVTLTSCNTSHRCLQLMIMTMLNILTSNKFVDTIIK